MRPNQLSYNVNYSNNDNNNKEFSLGLEDYFKKRPRNTYQ